MLHRHRWQYALYRGVAALLSALPHRAAPAVGSALGSLGFCVAARERRIALDNLAAALPELPAADRRRLARRSFRAVGAAACETLSAVRLAPEELRGRWVVEGSEEVARAQEGGRGALLLSAHLGCWELAAIAVALELGTVHLVSNALHNPLFERELWRLRRPFGLERIEQRGAARRMYKLLRAGGRVGVALDQRVPPEEGIDVTFLGRPSLASPLPAYLSLVTGAAVVPAFALPAGGRYRLALEPAILPEGGGPEAVAALTQRYMDVLAAAIRRHPEQWLWMYRRWRPADLAATARSSLATSAALLD
jgi:KDO2-lipid IV(A) lauroyltransferase